MSMHGVKAKWVITEQGNIKRYGIELAFWLKDISLNFEWFLAKPKSLWNRAMLDSFNEKVRNMCFDFVDEYTLVLDQWENKVKLNGNTLYHTLMEIVMDSINEIYDDNESLFLLKVSDTQLRKVRSERKDKLKEIKNIKRQIKDLDLELEKQKARKKAYEEAINEVWIERTVEDTPKKQTPKNDTPKQEKKKTTKRWQPSPANLSDLWL